MLSVMLPMWNAGAVGWLALEGLERQVDPGEWELIACEEQTDNDLLGYSGVMAYKDRLTANGCVKIQYLPLPRWVSLSMKYIYMKDYIHPDSTACLIQGVDNYPFPNRLKWTREMMAGGADVLHGRRAVFLNLATEEMWQWDTDLYRKPVAGTRTATGGIDMAFRSELWRRFRNPHPRRAGNDSWALREARRAKGAPLRTVIDDGEQWDMGLVTRGMNNLSGREFGADPWFIEDPRSWRDVLPTDLHGKMERLIRADPHELMPRGHYRA